MKKNIKKIIILTLINLSLIPFLVFAVNPGDGKGGLGLTNNPPETSFCSNENQQCSFSGFRKVFFGASGRYIGSVHKDGVSCIRSILDDPYPGVLKYCYIYPSEKDISSTKTATQITDETVTLSGSSLLFPNTTYGYFRYSTATVPPIFCNEIYGNNMKATNEVNLGSDANGPLNLVRKNFSTDVANLTPNTTYYYCAVTSEKNKIYYGKVSSFTTLPPAYQNSPLNSIQTKPATAVDHNSAYINGFFNTAIPATTWFEYRKKVTYQEMVNMDWEIQYASLSRKPDQPSYSIFSNLFNNANINTVAIDLLRPNIPISSNNLINNNITSLNSNAVFQPAGTLATMTAQETNTSLQQAVGPDGWIKNINEKSRTAGSSGAMSFFLNNLEKDRTYEFRAVIQVDSTGNNQEIYYGNTLTFRTSSSSVNVDNSGGGSGGSSGGGSGGGSGGNSSNIGTQLSLNQIIDPPVDAIVRFQEGIETVFARQLINNPELAYLYGYSPEQNLEKFAGETAHFFAKAFGYVGKDRKEIRVSYPDIAAYQLRQEGTRLIVYEYFGSKIVNVQNITSALRNNYNYEYYFNKK